MGGMEGMDWIGREGLEGRDGKGGWEGRDGKGGMRWERGMELIHVSKGGMEWEGRDEIRWEW